MNLSRRRFLELGSGALLSVALPRRVLAATTKPLCVSGVYPHLAVFNKTATTSAGECGIGALVPWAGRLWYLTYPPHSTRGSADKLYSLDANMVQSIHPESVGGTHAARMIHRESNQLIIGPYFISAEGRVRACDVKTQLTGRMTAVARHLTEPASLVYYFDMEGAVYEVDVNSLAVRKLFEKPVPGWHGKGAYTAQGRLVIANNGEQAAGRTPARWDCEVPPESPENAGVLAEWDGATWRIVMRRQFCEVTGPGGISGAADDKTPLWASGWDRRSVILELLDEGRWHTFRLPKSSHAFDPRHGWYTEWPRIREIGNGRFLMVMHGAMFDFPKAFSAGRTGGLRPLSQHLRYVPDFCNWNGQVVLATDETTILENPMAGQSQSNLWFGLPEDLATFGTPCGFGGVWLDDAVTAGQASDPFLIAGFTLRCLHVASPTKPGLTIDIELDTTGNGKWTPWKMLTVPADGYIHEVLPPDVNAEWLRLVPRSNGNVTAFVHQRAQPRHTPGSNRTLFEGLVRIGETNSTWCPALLRPAAHNRNLMVLARPDPADTEVYAEVDETLGFVISNNETRAGEVRTHCAIASGFSVDAASVLVMNGKQRLRLPKGPAAFDQFVSSNVLRAVREVESERSLANIHGTFHEIPRAVPFTKDQPLNYYKLRPIASHDRLISDFCTWRGLLVLAGCRTSTPATPNFFKSADATIGLWFGAVDDLWQLGKPVGVGGPWRDTLVRSGIPSDPYLMTGYDRKRVLLSHDARTPVIFRVEVDFANDGKWHPYASIEVRPNETFEHRFADAFGAHWVRLVAGKDCSASAEFHYE